MTKLLISKIFCQIQKYNNATSPTKCLDCLYKIILALKGNSILT